MVTATERYKEITQILRSKLAEERNYYMRTKAKLSLLPEEWNIVHEAIVAIANYYNGEIVRAKHDLADYMVGHEIHGNYADLDILPEIHECINQLPDLIPEHEELVAALDMIQTLTASVEEKSYAER